MTDANFNHGRQSKMARVCGLLLPAVLLFAASAPEARAIWRIKSDWSKVEEVAPGTRTTVLLFKDLAPRGKRKIKGWFRSASAESITLMLGTGDLRTLKREEIKRVLVPRPLKKRYQGWIMLAVTAASFAHPIVAASDIVISGKLLFAGTTIGAPTVFAFLASPRMGGIYNVPRDRRDEAAGGKRKSRRW